MGAATRTRNERFYFGEYQVPNTRYEMPSVHIEREDLRRAVHGISAESIVSDIPVKNHRETFERIADAYEARGPDEGGLTPGQLETYRRIRAVSEQARRNHQTFDVFDIDNDLAFLAVMLSTWMRGSKWTKIEAILPEIVEKSQAGLPISFYNAMSKTGPDESTVNAPDMGHLIHMARLGKLLSVKGGPTQVHVIDEYDYLGKRPDLFSGIVFDNGYYRESFLRLVSGFVDVHFREHPEILYDVFRNNVERFRADLMSPELVRNRHMFSRGGMPPPDEQLIPVTSYLEGSKARPIDTLHTSLIERRGGLFIGLINGFAPIHGVPIVYPEMIGERGSGRIVGRTEIVREVDVFSLNRAIEGSTVGVSSVWTNLDHNVEPDTFLGYIVHLRSEAPTAATVQEALGHALRDKSVTASSGIHDSSYIVDKIPYLSDSEKQDAFSKLPKRA